MPRASPSGPAPGETMRDPLTPPSGYLDHAAARRIVVGVLLTMLLAALDQVMVATALPTIAASLGDVENMSWVVTANLLGATAVTPLYSKLSDIRGRRAMLLIAIGVYAVGSLACALAPSMLALIFGRAVQGLGGGGLMPLVGAAIPLLLALTWGGRRYAWGSPQILALFVACATLWCLFAWRMMTAKQPFIPVSVLRDGAMRVGTAAAFFAVGVVIALTIVLPLYGQLALGLSVSESAWTIIALQSGAAVSSVVGGRLLVRFVHYKRVPLVSLLLSVAALIPLEIAPTGFSPAGALGLIALVGLGLGPTFPFTVVVVQNAVALHQLGVATGTMNFFRALGSTFIVSAFGAIVLAGAPVTRGMSAGAVLAGTDAAEAFRWGFAAAILCLMVALSCILALKEQVLRGSSRPTTRGG